MALTANVELLNTLPDVVLSGNKIPLQFQASTNFIENAGTKAAIILPWSAVAVADEYFDLLLYGQTVRFTCKLAPDNSGTQFHDNDQSLDLEHWVNLVADDLKKNYLIIRYYDVAVSYGDTWWGITITAKSEGSAYSLEFTAGTGIDVIPIESGKTGVDKAFRSFYGIVLILYCNSEFVSELVLNVDTEGLTEVDVADLLKPYLTTDFEWPESDTDFMFARTGAIAEWYFVYGERWGNLLYQGLTESETYYALLGGVSWMQQAKYNAMPSSFWTKLQNNKYFLSWAPTIKYIAPDEPVKLYFLNHTAATTLKLKAKLYNSSGDSTITVDSVTGVADKAVYEMVLSPEKVVYTGLDDESLIKIDVWVDNENDVPVSEVRTFIFDYSYYEHTRYFIFKNSLGAYEVLRTTGLMIRSNDYERETATVDIESDYTSKDRQELSVSNFEQQKFTIAMGWLSRYANAEEYRNWLRDFSLSKEVYQAIGASTLKPIRLTGNNLDNIKDRDNAIGFVFEFVNAFTDEHFTKEITWNLRNESFASDFELVQ
jgi:hypothetical protein